MEQWSLLAILTILYCTVLIQLLEFVELYAAMASWHSVSGAELEKIGDEKLARHDYSAFGEYIQQFLFADGADHQLKPEKSADQLLGLKEEGLEALIKSIADEL